MRRQRATAPARIKESTVKHLARDPHDGGFTSNSAPTRLSVVCESVCHKQAGGSGYSA